MRQAWRVCAAIYLAVQSTALMGQQYPEGITREVVAETDEFIAGLAHGPNGVTYSWTLDGKVFAVVNDNFPGQLVLDISEEVGFYHDMGMIGFALDPNFLSNGKMYCLYTVDRHHLLNYGTPNYDPNESEGFAATIGRLTRYQVSLSDYTTLLPESRYVLLGDSIHNGIPGLTVSHSIGALVFGTDGSLLITSGDCNSYGPPYNGEGEPESDVAYDLQGLEEGIITPDQHVGGFRAQHINSLCGKVLRVNPETGEGYPSNPFYHDSLSHKPQSKVWSLGLRNPFRMTVKPGSGSENPEDGQPGTIYMGDVGDWSWEEFNVANDKGLNFGWPIYQGFDPYYLYNVFYTENQLAPMSSTGGCNRDYYYYQELLIDAKENHIYDPRNLCNNEPLDEGTTWFVHERPRVGFINNVLMGANDPQVLVPTYDENGDASAVSIDNPASGVEHDGLFSGVSSVGGAFYEGSAFPEDYHNAYFHADLSGWLKVFFMNDEDEVERIETWDTSLGNILQLTYSQTNECLYVVTYGPSRVYKISFEGNRKPIVVATPEVINGASPLSVSFDASESYDPEGETISFNWDFGNGETSSSEVATVVFENNGEPEQYTILLEVTDSYGNVSADELTVSLNNNPPSVNITSFDDSSLYSITSTTNLALTADVFDQESHSDDLSYEWSVFLHHNSHFHREKTLTTASGEASISPLGCAEETYYYRIVLRVEDPHGLHAEDTRYLYPDCEGLLGQEWQRDGETQVWVYPSPATHEMKLLANAPMDERISYQIVDLQGKQLKAHDYISRGPEVAQRIDVGTLDAGIYLLKVRTSYWEEVVRIARH